MSSVNVSVNLWLIVFIKCMYIFNSVSWNVLEARNIPKAQTDISKSSSTIKYPKAPCTMGPTENLEQGRSKVSIEYPSISDIMESSKEREVSFTPLCRLPFSATASFWKPLLALSSIPLGFHLLEGIQCVVEFLFFGGPPPNSQISIQRLILTYECMTLAWFVP